VCHFTHLLRGSFLNKAIYYNARMDKKTLFMLAISGLLILILSATAYYKSELAKQENIIARGTPNKTCDLHKSDCHLELPGGGKVTLAINPRPIPLVSKLDIQVKVEGKQEVNSVLVDFQGTSMNMGPNTVMMKKLAEGQFSGNGMLPVCIRNSMEWQADVLIRTDAGTLSAPFIFITNK